MHYQTDTINTSEGRLDLTFIGHGSLIFTFNDLVLHIDPVADEADYSQLPKADIILVTHEHFDHLDSSSIELLRKEDTVVIAPQVCASKVEDCTIMHNGDTITKNGVLVHSVPAYNIIHMRSPGNPFHPKGVGNGYVLTFGDTTVYVAGDTENIPEMGELGAITVAFLPMNLPYTMTPEMAADAARTVKPKILYPYHFGDTDTARLITLLRDTPEIEVRIRDLQ